MQPRAHGATPPRFVLVLLPDACPHTCAHACKLHHARVMQSWTVLCRAQVVRERILHRPKTPFVGRNALKPAPREPNATTAAAAESRVGLLRCCGFENRQAEALWRHCL